MGPWVSGRLRTFARRVKEADQAQIAGPRWSASNPWSEMDFSAHNCRGPSCLAKLSAAVSLRLVTPFR